MAGIEGIMEKVIKLADNSETLRNPKGIYFTVTDPSDGLVDIFEEVGITLVSVKREITYFAPNEVLNRFRKEVE